MIDDIERNLEAARREYDAVEETLFGLSEFRDFVTRLRFDAHIQPSPALSNNCDFNRWNELAALISELHRARELCFDPARRTFKIG